ncbi:MAG: proton-conducting transporter membrane subunit, partial [Polyangia bacterium]
LAPLRWISFAAAALIIVVAACAAALQAAARRKPASVEVETWDCGYARPTARMQYTSSSFGEMIVGLFAWVLRPTQSRPTIAAVFPSQGGYHSHVPETVLDRLVVPATSAIARVFVRLRWIQRGSTQRYLLYILITLVVLFVWRRS